MTSVDGLETFHILFFGRAAFAYHVRGRCFAESVKRLLELVVRTVVEEA
jgi:hypothetical protein